MVDSGLWTNERSNATRVFARLSSADTLDRPQIARDWKRETQVANVKKTTTHANIVSSGARLTSIMDCCHSGTGTLPRPPTRGTFEAIWTIEKLYGLPRTALCVDRAIGGYRSSMRRVSTTPSKFKSEFKPGLDLPFNFMADRGWKMEGGATSLFATPACARARERERERLSLCVCVEERLAHREKEFHVSREVDRLERLLAVCFAATLPATCSCSRGARTRSARRMLSNSRKQAAARVEFEMIEFEVLRECVVDEPREAL